MKKEIKKLAKDLKLEIDFKLLDSQSNKNLVIIYDMMMDLINYKATFSEQLDSYEDAAKKSILEFLKLTLVIKNRDQQIRNYYEKGLTQNAIAHIFRLSQGAVSLIINKK